MPPAESAQDNPNELHPLTQEERKLYGELYRCEACSFLTDLKGVQPFTSPNSAEGQTVPVSHFGHIRKSVIWLVVNNPKGNRNDPNVGLSVKEYAASRGLLRDADIDPIFNHLSDYDFEMGSPEFFGPWRQLLNDLIWDGRKLRFESGDICAVDLIKCPTRTGWLTYVKTDEGKQVWKNCHGLKLKGKAFEKGSEFLVRQIELHKPRIVLLPGTKLNGQGYTERTFGKPNKRLKALIRGVESYVVNVRSIQKPKRLAIELGGARELKTVLANEARLAQARSVIQAIIQGWDNWVHG